MSTTSYNMETNFFFQKSLKLNFDLYYNTETKKFDFFSKKFEIDEIEFCPYPEFPFA